MNCGQLTAGDPLAVLSAYVSWPSEPASTCELPAASASGCLHTSIGHRVGGWIGDHLIPELAPVGPVREVAAVNRRGRVAPADVEIPVRTNRRRGVDWRPAGHPDADDTQAGGPGGRAIAPLVRTEAAAGSVSPTGRGSAVGQVEPVEEALPVADLDGRRPAVVELDGRRFHDTAWRVVQEDAVSAGTPGLGQRHRVGGHGGAWREGDAGDADSRQGGARENESCRQRARVRQRSPPSFS